MKILTKDYWTVYRQTYAMQLVVSGIAAAMDLKIWFGMCAVMFLLVYISSTGSADLSTLHLKLLAT